LRFSLRTLFIAISLFVILPSMELNRLHKQRLIVAEIKQPPGAITPGRCQAVLTTGETQVAKTLPGM
jgi:hypothetical protein